MKHFIMSIIVVISTATAIWSQTQKHNDLYLSGGVGVPSSPEAFSKNWSSGYIVGGGVGISFTKASTLIFLADYGSFPTDNENILNMFFGPSHSSASVSGGNISTLTISGNVKWPLFQYQMSAIPYIIAGVGYFSTSPNDMTVTGPNFTMTLSGKGKSAFFGSFGAGLDLAVSETANIFIETRYLLALTSVDNTCYIPIKAGVRIGL